MLDMQNLQGWLVVAATVAVVGAHAPTPSAMAGTPTQGVRPGGAATPSGTKASTTLPISKVLAKPWFSTTPAELRTEVARIVGLDARYREAAVTILSDETQLVYDGKGRVDSRQRLVFIVNTQVGADDWGTVSLSYSPFYQDKPKLRIRVIGRDNSVTELDPTLVVDRPDVEESSNIFSDTRKLDAPLPRLLPGAIVEEEFTYHDREPMLAAGTVRSLRIGRGIPVFQEIVAVDAPVGLPVTITPRGFALVNAAPVRTLGSTAGRTQTTYTFAPGFDQPDYQYAAPFDAVQYPVLHISTAVSWAAVAANYRQLVEPKISAAGFVVPAHVKGATEAATVANVVAWVHSRVRYTGIEVGDAAIIPWTPAETLARGFGDCKDKASLLVAALRGVGIKADLAVLTTGPGPDVERAAPGLGRFDHAIVRAVVAGKPMWIDGTEDLLPPGVLPIRDQGRLALVLATDTKNLQLTPFLLAAQSVSHEIRAYDVNQDGGATVTESTTETGVLFDNERRWILNTKRDELIKSLSTYAKDVYQGEFVAYHGENPADLAVPFTFRLDVREAKRVFASRTQLDAYLYPAPALNELPGAIRGDDSDYDAEAKSRTLDFLIIKSNTRIVENRIVVPVDFELPSLTARSEQKLGVFTLITTRKIVGREITITFTLATEQTRLTPAEFRATRKAVRALYEAAPEHIIMLERSAALSTAGKHQAAIAEAQRQVAAAPNKALGYGRLSAAYLATGLGKAAWQAAQKATEVEPTSSDAYVLLGFARTHDWLGRYHGAGFDRRAAINAYQRALVLNPNHLGGHLGLAKQLLTDARNRTSVVKAELQAVIAHLVRAKELNADDEVDTQIASTAFILQDFATAETAIRAIADNKIRASMMVALTALRDGAPAAIAMADSLNLGTHRDTALVGAMGHSILRRKYDVLHGLVGSTQAATARTIQQFEPRLVPLVLAQLDRRKPETLVLAATLSSAGFDFLPLPIHDKKLQQTNRDKVTQASREMPEALRMYSDLGAAEMFSAVYTTTVEGSQRDGWHVILEVGGQRSGLYAIWEGGRAVALGDSEATQGLGLYALERIAQRDVETARRFLTWLVGDLTNFKRLPGLVALWDEEVDRLHGAAMGRDFLEFFAAVVAATAEQANNTIAQIVTRCAVQGVKAQTICPGIAMAMASASHNWPTLERLARGHLQLHLDEATASTLLVQALVKQQRSAEALSFVQALLQRKPKSLLGLRLWVLATLDPSIDIAQRNAAFAALKAAPDNELGDLNNLAWFHLYADADLQVAQQMAEELATKGGSSMAIVANTIAAIAAESNDPSRAWTYFEKSRSQHPFADLTAADWYVYGRILEAYGMRDDALAAYRSVKSLESEGPSAYNFAQRGLARLGQKVTSKPAGKP